MNRVRRSAIILSVILLLLSQSACRGPRQEEVLREVAVLLDWTPNTNHTGLYVAKSEGYFAEEGLDVSILLPGDAGVIQMVAGGNVHFGVGYQEELTQARVQGLPILSVAAIIQHNTSGFASPKEKNITDPRDFVGKRYGGWGSPTEMAVIDSVMQTRGVNADSVTLINIGDADYFTAVTRDVDFTWAFYAWTGIEAELRDFPLNMLFVKDLAPELDYYTPLLMTGEKLAEEDPDLVKAFLRAVSKGYEKAAQEPDKAAGILLEAEPDLDEALVRASQAWLADKYQDDAPRWGEQKPEVWVDYTAWMLEKGLLEKDIDISKAFTNDFLPTD